MGENWQKGAKYLELLSCKFVHLCVCWSVWKIDESKRYLWHFVIFLVLTILTLLGGASVIPEVYWGVGGHPSSQM